MSKFLTTVKTLAKAHAKAIAGVLTPAITFASAKYGLNLSPATVATLVSLLTGGAVFAIPNTPAPKP